ncbi:MAG: glycosyltransferase family 2 protein [Deltaproteobacteria bacterium]|nr:glycosyltransferase family 2 protein [Deltaproteobacteria bacterium]
MRREHKIFVIIPVLNEADTIADVVRAIPSFVDEIIVADNGSTDNSPRIAQATGATVVHEPRRGYGAACLKAMNWIDSHAMTDSSAASAIVVYLDGDGADDPAEMALLTDPIIRREALFVLGSRVLGQCERGALTVTQRFGNWLSCALLQLLFQVRQTDLGPFRAIRLDALHRLNMDDLDFGWTVQMQARAAALKLPTLEVPVNYRNRAGGASKVSGTIRGVLGAGTTILRVIFLEAQKANRLRTRGGTQYHAG